MDNDELLPPKKASGALADLMKEDLDRLSRDEVLARIVALEAEIARAKARLNDASAVRSAADDLFRK